MQVLSDDELINATIGNNEDEDEDERDVEEVPLYPAVTEMSAVLSGLEGFCFFESAHLERLGIVVASAYFTV